MLLGACLPAAQESTQPWIESAEAERARVRARTAGRRVVEYEKFFNTTFLVAWNRLAHAILSYDQQAAAQVIQAGILSIRPEHKLAIVFEDFHYKDQHELNRRVGELEAELIGQNKRPERGMNISLDEVIQSARRWGVDPSSALTVQVLVNHRFFVAGKPGEKAKIQVPEAQKYEQMLRSYFQQPNNHSFLVIDAIDPIFHNSP